MGLTYFHVVHHLDEVDLEQKKERPDRVALVWPGISAPLLVRAPPSEGVAIPGHCGPIEATQERRRDLRRLGSRRMCIARERHSYLLAGAE